MRALAKIHAVGSILAALSACTPAEPENVYEPIWYGAMPCSSDMYMEFAELPGGGTLVESPTGRGRMYEVSGGEGQPPGQVYISGPRVAHYPIHARTFSGVLDVLEAENPLAEFTDLGTEDGVILAYIEYGFTMVVDYVDVTPRGPTIAGPDPNDLTIVMPAFVHLLRWEGYKKASELDQERWKRMQCRSIHHELGHLLVSAETAARAIPDMRKMQAPWPKDLEAKFQKRLDLVLNEAEIRNEIYHSEILAMGPLLGETRPYLDLPYSWLVEGGSVVEGELE